MERQRHFSLRESRNPSVMGRSTTRVAVLGLSLGLEVKFSSVFFILIHSLTAATVNYILQLFCRFLGIRVSKILPYHL